jgi:hypothetical protein
MVASSVYSLRVPTRTFTYEEAVAVLPDVQRITSAAVDVIEALDSEDPADYQRVLNDWADSILALGIEVKGLWLVDFDSGAGYYCWKHPEPALEYFHGYDEGLPGRVKLN